MRRSTVRASCVAAPTTRTKRELRASPSTKPISCSSHLLMMDFATESRIPADVDSRLGPVPAQLPDDALDLLDDGRRGILTRRHPAAHTTDARRRRCTAADNSSNGSTHERIALRDDHSTGRRSHPGPARSRAVPSGTIPRTTRATSHRVLQGVTRCACSNRAPRPAARRARCNSTCSQSPVHTRGRVLEFASRRSDPPCPTAATPPCHNAICLGR